VCTKVDTKQIFGDTGRRNQERMRQDFRETFLSVLDPWGAGNCCPGAWPGEGEDLGQASFVFAVWST
jgi:hypothetical protein